MSSCDWLLSLMPFWSLLLLGFVLPLVVFLLRVEGVWLRLLEAAARVCCPLLLGTGRCDLTRQPERRSDV